MIGTKVDGEAQVMEETLVQRVWSVGMVGLRGACDDRERKGNGEMKIWMGMKRDAAVSEINKEMSMMKGMAKYEGWKVLQRFDGPCICYSGLWRVCRRGYFD